jgi:hypothetical protein
MLGDISKPRPQQATGTNVSNAATDLAEALGNNRETLQFALPQQRDAPFAYTG